MPWQTPISLLGRDLPRSYLSRHFAWLYLLVIVTVSLYPFSGWSWPPIPILAYLWFPAPYYQARVDDVLNVLAYIPFGAALWGPLRARLGGFLAVLAGTVLGGALSFGMETLQVFLPSRVASNLDILHNTVGTAIGGLFSWTLGSRYFMRQASLLRHHWFVDGGWADFGLALLVIWFVTQLDPSIPLFGVVARPQGLPQPFESPIDDPSMFLRFLEAADAMFNLLVVTLLVSLLLEQRRYLWQLIGLVIGLAILVKLTTAGMLLKPIVFFQWLNWRTLLGIAVGLVLLPLLLSLTVVAQATVCAAALAVSLLVDWLWPLQASPNAALVLFKWRSVQLSNFNGMSHTMADLWPWLMLIFLVGFARTHARRARSTWF